MKKTTMNKWILASLVLVLSTGLNAQDAQGVAEVDFFGRTQQDLSKLPKMERDIIILQNVLNGLFNGSKGSFYASTRGAKGIYVPGKGVIFNIGAQSNASQLILIDQLAASGGEDAVTVVDGQTSANISEDNESIEERLKSLTGDFLVNYGSILTDLKAGEKVMLNVNYDALKKDDPKETNRSSIHGGTIVYRGGKRLDKKRMVSAIDYSTINSYLTGKSTLEQATKKIDFNVVDRVSSSMQDARIMAGILDDLFQSNFEGAFRRSGKTSWTYFEGFGLMYDLNIRGNYGNLIGYTVAGDGTPALRSQSSNDRKDSNKLAEESFDELIDLVKESLITYGRTLRSVKSDEVIIFNVNFGSSFRKTKLPKAIRLQVSKSQIEDFSRGKKTISQLKKEIELKKLSASTFNSYNHSFPSMVYETAPDVADHIVIGGTATSSGN
ncbi:hypothetical protein [Roseivirga misakiensis]|uniref:Uncharacterized protein n=1 Tax=Roseivirga misakiensis TaxID=1563681 RepID=A0A1E5SYH3_9BACT|nr:hypothetical protein [Roseivirga misakiensis]OEK04162.1 hypothetical protein BFP71_11795 [Roseivirga misakiensis]